MHCGVESASSPGEKKMDAQIEAIPLTDELKPKDATPQEDVVQEKVEEDVAPKVSEDVVIPPEQMQTESVVTEEVGATTENTSVEEIAPENGEETLPVEKTPKHDEEGTQEEMRPNNGAPDESENVDVPKSSTVGEQEPQNNGREVTPKCKYDIPQQTIAKIMRIRSNSNWKSSAAILKKRSIKWLNKNKYHLGRNARKDVKGFGFRIFTEEERKKLKEQVDEDVEEDEEMEEEEEEVEEDFEVENKAKRSRMDDDVEIVVAKSGKVDEKVFCDRKNGKKEKSDSHADNATKSPDVDAPKAKSHTKLPNFDDPTKKLCLELEMNFASHDKMLTEYIEATANDTPGDIQRHVEQIIVELQTLNDMIRAKEMEWNNMLHLKKVKEEIVARLTRRRHVMEFAAAKFGTSLDYGDAKSEDSIAKITQALLSRAAMVDEAQKSNSTSSEVRNAQHLKSSDVLASLTATGDVRSAEAFASDLFNGHNTRLTQQQMGRQGAIKDVKSIIADYRQRHPEIVPRRGRRMKPHEKEGGNSRPSSADSSHSNATNSNFASSSAGASGNLSFKDVLVQFAKLSQSDRQMISTATEGATASTKPPPPYPEVTLYPVSSQSNEQQPQVMLNNTNSHSNSLLHGILTKSTTRPNAAGFTSFSPTLARLLTAPERITNTQGGAQFQQQLNPALNLSKSHSEITITPVVSQTTNMMQQQQQRFENCNSSRMKQENVFNIDDEADDSADRLVIDEGGGERNLMDTGTTKEQQISIVGQEFHENEVPECQGCKKREAQFVCAGCGNQWYCSRECQVSAWDEHSEVCTG